MPRRDRILGEGRRRTEFAPDSGAIADQAFVLRRCRGELDGCSLPHRLAGRRALVTGAAGGVGTLRADIRGRGNAERHRHPPSQHITPPLRGWRSDRPRAGRGELPLTADRGSANTTGDFPDALVLATRSRRSLLDGARCTLASVSAMALGYHSRARCPVKKNENALAGTVSVGLSSASLPRGAEGGV